MSCALYKIFRRLLKPPNNEAAPSIGFSEMQDPYMIAAYLKYWKNAYDDNLECEGDDHRGWKPSSAPIFNVAVRFGSMDARQPFNFPLMDREISPEGEMTSSWGSRGYGKSHIDEWFDFDPPHRNLPIRRPVGSPGLVLIHIVSRDSKGRDGNGENYHYDRPTLALSIPRGGPAVMADVVGD